MCQKQGMRQGWWKNGESPWAIDPVHPSLPIQGRVGSRDKANASWTAEYGQFEDAWYEIDFEHVFTNFLAPLHFFQFMFLFVD